MVSDPAAPPDEVELVEGKVRLDNGEEVTRRYMKGKMLGKGGFAKCYLATCVDTSEQYALKVVSKASLQKSSARQRQLRTEVRIHRTLSHSHIVRFEHSFETDTHVYIVLELCPNKSLAELLKRRKRLEECEVVYYLLQLVSAVRHMHARGVIHRDLKLGNIFLDQDLHCKVGDLGLAARCRKSERKQTLCGTPNYIAPEILDNTGHSFQVDLWSLGVVAYTMLVGRPPYECADIRSTYKRILANTYSFPLHVPLSESARHLIRSLLQTKPENRPSLDEVELLPFLARAKPHLPRTLPLTTLHQPPPADWLVLPPRHARTVRKHADSTASSNSPPGPILVSTATASSPAAPPRRLASSAAAVVEPCTRRPLGLRDINQVNGQHQQMHGKPKPQHGATDAAVSKKGDPGAAASKPASGSTRAASAGGRISPRAIAQQHEHHRRHRQQHAAPLPSSARTTSEAAAVLHARQPVVAARPAVDEAKKTTKPVMSPPLPPSSSSSSSSPSRPSRSSNRPRRSPASDSPSGPALPPGLLTTKSPGSSAATGRTSRRALALVSPSPPVASPPRSAQLANRPLSQQDSATKRRPAAGPLSSTTTTSPAGRAVLGSRAKSEDVRPCSTRQQREAPVVTTARRQADGGTTTARAVPAQQPTSSPPPASSADATSPLEVITRRIARFLHEAASIQARRGRLPLPAHPPRLPTILQPLAPKTWITRYCDFSQKYGVGYLLSDGCAGVLFNDSTKIVVDACGETATYLERSSRLCTPDKKGRGAVSEQVFAMESYPPELHKKVTLLRHFRKFLLEGGGVPGAGAEQRQQGPQGSEAAGDDKRSSPCVYLRKWSKARSAVVFQLSSRVVQVIFSSEEEEVLITPDARVIMHVESNGRRASYSLAALVEAPMASMVKRLMHTNEVLREVVRK